MKKLLFILIAGVMSFGTLNAQLVSVFHEVAYTDGDAVIPGYPAGHTTYRVYATLTDPTDFLSSVYAATNDQLTIGSSTNNIWNTAFGGVTADALNPAFFPPFPEAEWDSMVTIGKENSVSPGGSITLVESLPGTAVFTGFGSVPSSGNVTMIDGAWFALNGDANGYGVGVDNRVLLAQITTDGEPMYNLNIQVFPLSDGGNAELYVGDCNTVDVGDIDGSCMGLHFPEDALCCAAPVPGCIDTNACNFDSLANVDDGSCCFDNCVTLTVGGGSYDSEITFDLYDGGGVLVVSGAAPYTGDFCLADDCYQLDMFDSFGDGWNGATYSFGPHAGSLDLTTEDGSTATDYLALGAAVCPILGCMDTLACNYDSNANTDDGSCAYPAANDLCAGAIDIDGNVNGALIAADNGGCTTQSGQNPGCGSTSTDPFDLWYSFTYNGGDVTIENIESGTLGDGRLAVWDACGGTVIECQDDNGLGAFETITLGCPELTLGNTYLVQAGGFSGATGTFDLSITHADAPGCMDTLAINYDACASVDDGSCLFSAPSCGDNVTYCYVNGDASSWTYSVNDLSTNIIVTFNGGSVESATFDQFVVYDGPDNLSPVLYANPAGITTDLTGMVFQASGTDITLEINSDGSWSCDTGEIPGPWNYDITCADLVGGCNDAGACNYDSLADFDDGSCDYSCIGCMDSLACNYDPAATIAGTCDFDNDGIDCATPIMPSAFGTCTTVAGSMIGATDSPESDFQFTPNGGDRWYSFVAMSPGASIKMTTVDFDAQLILLDASYTEVDEDDANFSIGDEILNIGNLVEGDTYYISASSWSAPSAFMDYEICIETLPDTRCDYGAGPYDLCDMFKADWVGADGYYFYFLGQTDGLTYEFENWTFPQDYVQLFDVAGLPWDQTYDVSIDALYDRVDGNGANEQIDVVNNEPCTMIVEGSPTAQVHPGKNCANHGPHWLGNYISATPWICGSTDWTWEFTRTDVTELPFEHFGSTFYNYLRLSEVAGLVEGATYDVRVKPEFANGAPTVYGATQCISIIGPAGNPVEGPVAMDNTIERIEDLVVTPEASIYPNPNAGDFFNINLVGVQSEKIAVDIYDVFGKLVQAEEITVNEGSVNSIVRFNDEVSSGIYVVNITMDGTVMSERLVIEK